MTVSQWASSSTGPNKIEQRDVIVQFPSCPKDSNRKLQRSVGLPYLKDPIPKEQHTVRPCLKDSKKKGQRFMIGKCPCSYPKDSIKNEHLNAVGQCLPTVEKLRKKELCLIKKEKELLRMQKELQKQRTQLKNKFETKAKADLAAAKKLNRARKKLQLTVSASNRIAGHQKPKKKNSLSCTRCMEPTKSKWLNKIYSILDKLQDGYHSYFCERKEGKSRFSELCALYAKKIAEADRQLCLNCIACTRNLDNFSGNTFGMCPNPWRSSHQNIEEANNQTAVFCSCSTRSRTQGRCRLEAAAGDCFGMAMAPNFCSWPYPRQTCRMQLEQTARRCCTLIAGLILWIPCLLCLALLCFCYFCCCNDCC